MSDFEIQNAVYEYFRARARLIELGRKFPERFAGNDNMMGRFGEFIALQFLERLGQKPTKVAALSNTGFDLVEGETRTQVKLISAENRLGRSVRLKEPWDQLVLIQLCPDYRPLRLGLLTKMQYEMARNSGQVSSPNPFVSLSMLGRNGLFGKYGKVYEKKEISACQFAQADAAWHDSGLEAP